MFQIPTVFLRDSGLREMGIGLHVKGTKEKEDLERGMRGKLFDLLSPNLRERALNRDLKTPFDSDMLTSGSALFDLRSLLGSLIDRGDFEDPNGLEYLRHMGRGALTHTSSSTLLIGFGEQLTDFNEQTVEVVRRRMKAMEVLGGHLGFKPDALVYGCGERFPRGSQPLGRGYISGLAGAIGATPLNDIEIPFGANTQHIESLLLKP